MHGGTKCIQELSLKVGIIQHALRPHAYSMRRYYTVCSVPDWDIQLYVDFNPEKFQIDTNFCTELKKKLVLSEWGLILNPP